MDDPSTLDFFFRIYFWGSKAIPISVQKRSALRLWAVRPAVWSHHCKASSWPWTVCKRNGLSISKWVEQFDMAKAYQYWMKSWRFPTSCHHFCHVAFQASAEITERGSNEQWQCGESSGTGKPHFASDRWGNFHVQIRKYSVAVPSANVGRLLMVMWYMFLVFLNWTSGREVADVMDLVLCLASHGWSQYHPFNGPAWKSSWRSFYGFGDGHQRPDNFAAGDKLLSPSGITS